MKYKPFIFCLILFSLNNIIFGNFANELSSLEPNKTISINIDNKVDSSNLLMEITNDTLISTGRINISVDPSLNDLIELNISNSDMTYVKITFYNETEKGTEREIVNPKKSTKTEYNYVLKTCNIPKKNKLYVIVSINETLAKIDYESKDYTFALKYKLNKYGFTPIKDDQPKPITSNSEISYVQNNELLYGGKKIILTFLGTGINTFKVEYAFDEKNDYKELEKNFFNGFGLIIDNTILTIEHERIKFKITIIAEYEIITAYPRKYSTNSISMKEYDLFDIIIYKNKSYTNSQCFKLDISSKDANKKYTLNYISYMKNIMAKYSSNINKPINQESMYEEVNGFDSVCFELNDSNQNAIGTLSFELMDISIKDPKDDDNEYRVIRALPTYHYLSNSASFCFKPEAFLKLKAKFLNIHFKMIEGVSQLSTGTFTNSGFNINKEYKDFNGFIFVRESLSTYNDKTFAMIKCIDEEKKN